MSISEYDYTERPKQFERNDFWRQVRRTINGKPVDESQIQLIVVQIVSLLRLAPVDKLLDIGCGNGALSARLEAHIGELLGVDLSEYLVKVAIEHFSKPQMRFEQRRLEDIIGHPDFRKFNKGLLYGVSSFLDDVTITNLVEWFFSQESGSLMFGNVRDRNLAEKFYGSTPNMSELDNIGSSMGKWRTREWYAKLAAIKDLKVQFFKMPDEFYASKYYFDVLLTKG
jgi:SAM-dependent methyltransferase